MKNNAVYVLIVLVFVGLLVYITINKKAPVSTGSQMEQVVEDTNNMGNEQVEGVKVTVIQEGTGVVAKTGDTVAMNYTGTLTDGTAFDSNIDPKFGHAQPFVFTIGAVGPGQVIQGWNIGVIGMKVGEKRKLEIDSEFGYGTNGAKDSEGNAIIPPNAKLNFEVELIAIKPE